MKLATTTISATKPPWRAARLDLWKSARAGILPAPSSLNSILRQQTDRLLGRCLEGASTDAANSDGVSGLGHQDPFLRSDDLARLYRCLVDYGLEGQA